VLAITSIAGSQFKMAGAHCECVDFASSLIEKSDKNQIINKSRITILLTIVNVCQ
jgi:hypothetical protein